MFIGHVIHGNLLIFEERVRSRVENLLQETGASGMPRKITECVPPKKTDWRQNWQMYLSNARVSTVRVLRHSHGPAQAVPIVHGEGQVNLQPNQSAWKCNHRPSQKLLTWGGTVDENEQGRRKNIFSSRVFGLPQTTTASTVWIERVRDLFRNNYYFSKQYRLA